MRGLSCAVLFCTLLSMTVTAQTKGPATSSPKKPAAGGAKHIPAIKCSDPDTAAACKSFKELVDARDQRIILKIMGQSGESGAHAAYVCFRPKSDDFSVIDFFSLEAKEYRPFVKEDISSYADSSAPELVPGFRKHMRESIERIKEMQEKTEFSEIFGRSGKPAVSLFTKEQWYQDHSESFVYSVGFVMDEIYQDGFSVKQVYENGEWFKFAGNKGGMQNDPAAWFLGGFAWLEKFNLEHGDVSAIDDDPEQGHIGLNPEAVYIHYKYKSKADSMVDYTIRINRLTGRYVEYFESADDKSEVSGTCLVFK